MLVSGFQLLLDRVDPLVEVVHEVLLVFIGIIVGAKASGVFLLAFLKVDYFLF